MTQEYLGRIKINNLPRLPLEGRIDLTYRCNNNCRHCWLRIPSDAVEQEVELTFTEIKKIAGEAKKMGCRRWSISGGEPMLRPDFSEIFDYLTANSCTYTINTNGTLITPKIARLMKRKGAKMVALYGATQNVHDYVTRNPGSFEAAMRGFRYLKEAGAGFIVQLIPMKDNYHQFEGMIKLAESLSRYYRIGAAWLYFSASGDKTKNAEIARQRLLPKDVVELDKPACAYEEPVNELPGLCEKAPNDGFLFSSCVNSRRDFHIDPYGKMSFCNFIKDSVLRYDLKKGNFQDGWENFIPGLAGKIKITQEYKKNCGSCGLRRDCRICPVHGFLEHRDFNKKVGYLCAVAKESGKFKEDWQKRHRRYFKIAEITVRIESDLPFKEDTFHPKFKLFETKPSGKDVISVCHHFSLPDLDGKNLGEQVYRKAPWAIYKNNGSWVYLGISPLGRDNSLHRVAAFNADHSRAIIYNYRKDAFLKGNLHSLTMFPSDQILLARVLADRGGFYLHSSGVNFKGKGLLFVGHSGAGKSTMARMLKSRAEILCDDRIVVRKAMAGASPEVNVNRSPSSVHRQLNSGFRIYGTWSHGDVPDVSAGSAPLKAIMFLEQAVENRVIPLKDKKEIIKRLLSCLIKPFVTVEWWEKILIVIEEISREVPCYALKFDKSGKVVKLLEEL